MKKKKFKNLINFFKFYLIYFKLILTNETRVVIEWKRGRCHSDGHTQGGVSVSCSNRKATPQTPIPIATATTNDQANNLSRYIVRQWKAVR